MCDRLQVLTAGHAQRADRFGGRGDPHTFRRNRPVRGRRLIDWELGGGGIDIAVVGGGINGCSLARLAALSGFRAALFEKNDFGCGVTSRSTRLIHGGLRYLESFRFGLVRESLRDRKTLLREFPGQIAPQPFLIPVYAGDSRPRWHIAAGLEMYRLLAGGDVLPRPRRLSAEAAREAEPGLAAEGLRGGFVYYDCQAVYPERLALEMALQAEEAGAEVRNHTAVKGFLVKDSRVVGVRVEVPGGEEEIRARLVVNAAGAWADRVLRLLPGAQREPLLTLLNGAHIVLPPFAGAPRRAVYHEARADRRPFFVVPWRGLYLVGTTETPFAGDPERAAPTEREIEYLLREMNGLFPRADARRESILYAYCGSRPLLRAEGGNMNAASRDHAVYDHETHDGVKGLLTMLGGKLTTAPSFARQTLREAAAKLGAPAPIDPDIPEAPAPAESDAGLAAIYGPRAPRLRAFLAERPERAAPAAPGCPAVRGQIEFAVRCEKAHTLGDILLRRTGLAFDPNYSPAWAQAAASAAADALGWDRAATENALAAFEDELGKTLAPVHRSSLAAECAAQARLP